MSREVIIAGKEILVSYQGNDWWWPKEGPKTFTPFIVDQGPWSGGSNFVNSRGQEVSHSYSLVVGLDTLVGIVECIIISRLILLV